MMSAIKNTAPSARIMRQSEKIAQLSPNRRDRRKHATRQALLDATHSLLASRSLDALTVDQIASEADVAKGTFYNYFADKEAVARELASHVRLLVENDITRANEGIADPAARIGRAFCCVVRFSQDAPQQAVAMMRLFPHATDPSAPINSGVRGDVAEGLSRGRFIASSEDVAIACIVGVFTAGVNRALDLPPSDARELTRELGAILLHGLGLGRAQAASIMNKAVESILPSTKERSWE
jgi:AcrR family transcriptional regulator